MILWVKTNLTHFWGFCSCDCFRGSMADHRVVWSLEASSSWLWVGWLMLYQVDWWWRREAEASLPARRTHNFPCLVLIWQRPVTFPYAVPKCCWAKKNSKLLNRIKLLASWKLFKHAFKEFCLWQKSFQVTQNVKNVLWSIKSDFWGIRIRMKRGRKK